MLYISSKQKLPKSAANTEQQRLDNMTLVNSKVKVTSDLVT